MLASPSAALGGPGQPTSRRTELIADWIELSAYVEEVEIYRHNVRDRLTEAYFTVDEDDASRAVNDAWRALRRRSKAIGASYPFDIARNAVTLKTAPEPPYLFFLVLSSPEYFSGFSLSRGGGFRNVFELVTIEAVRQLLPNWEVSWAGATSREMKSAGGVAPYIARLLKTKIRNRLQFANAQDGGVDFIAVVISGDGRAAGPALWGQCATGMDWDQKLEEPSFNRWNDAVRILTEPVRAFAVPFAFDVNTWDDAAVRSRGWILDRERLARALPLPLDPKLTALITAWLEKETTRLPIAA
jgi:hypothetical protein